MKRLSEIEGPAAVTKQLVAEYRTVDPDFNVLSLGERLKLLKLSRSCSKKTLERYFHIDPKSESLVYYEK